MLLSIETKMEVSLSKETLVKLSKLEGGVSIELCVKEVTESMGEVWTQTIKDINGDVIETLD